MQMQSQATKAGWRIWIAFNLSINHKNTAFDFLLNYAIPLAATNSTESENEPRDGQSTSSAS